jgi:hypothetical protein
MPTKNKKLVIKNKNVNKNNIKITINPKKKKGRKSAPIKKGTSSIPNIINVTLPQIHPSNYHYPMLDKPPVKVSPEKTFTDANKLNEVGTLVRPLVGNIPVEIETQTDLDGLTIDSELNRLRDLDYKKMRENERRRETARLRLQKKDKINYDS